MGCQVSPIHPVIESTPFSDLRPLNRSAKWIDRHRCWARQNEVGWCQMGNNPRATNHTKPILTLLYLQSPLVRWMYQWHEKSSWSTTQKHGGTSPPIVKWRPLHSKFTLSRCLTCSGVPFQKTLSFQGYCTTHSSSPRRCGGQHFPIAWPNSFCTQIQQSSSMHHALSLMWKNTHVRLKLVPKIFFSKLDCPISKAKGEMAFTGPSTLHHWPRAVGFDGIPHSSHAMWCCGRLCSMACLPLLLYEK